MNRAKKRKLSPLVPDPIFAEDTPEPEEACPAPAPAPSPSPPPTAPEEPEQDARCPSEMDWILYYRAKQAEKNFIQVHRRAHERSPAAQQRVACPPARRCLCDAASHPLSFATARLFVCAGAGVGGADAAVQPGRRLLVHGPREPRAAPRTSRCSTSPSWRSSAWCASKSTVWSLGPL